MPFDIMNFTIPVADCALTIENNLTFSVKKKNLPRGIWILVCETQNLQEAVIKAMEILSSDASVVQTGVFVETESGGFIYWGSDSPELFNSVVLER